MNAPHKLGVDNMELSSPMIGKITEALSKAQAEMPTLHKDKEIKTSKYNFEYASYDAIRLVCVETLSKHGLVVTHQIWAEGEAQYLITQISHTSGEFMRSRALLPIQDKTEKAFGSAVTYTKRYSLVALLMLAADDDDDGAASDGIEAKFEKKTTKIQQLKKEPEGKYGPKFLKLRGLIEESGVDMTHFYEYITHCASARQVSSEVYCTNALLKPEIAEAVGAKYAERLAEKQRVA
jgi:hypothetical protein